jgi:hypothetical protein
MQPVAMKEALNLWLSSVFSLCDVSMVPPSYWIVIA